MLCQIVRRRGVERRVERGTEPVVELDLQAGEYVVDFDLREAPWVSASRKTTDWTWRATIASVPQHDEIVAFLNALTHSDGHRLALSAEQVSEVAVLVRGSL